MIVMGEMVLFCPSGRGRVRESQRGIPLAGWIRGLGLGLKERCLKRRSFAFKMLQNDLVNIIRKLKKNQKNKKKRPFSIDNSRGVQAVITGGYLQ